MEEIADYISNPTGTLTETPSGTEETSTATSLGDMADTYRGMARIFQRIADDVEGKIAHVDADGGAGAAETVRAWIEEGRRISAKPSIPPMVFTGNEPTGGAPR